MDEKSLAQIAQSLYDNNLKMIISKLRDSKCFYFLLSFTDTGVITEIKGFSRLGQVRVDPSTVLLIHKNGMVRFGNTNKLKNELQRNIAAAIENDLLTIFNLKEVKFIAKARGKAEMVHKIDQNLSRFEKRFDLKLNDIPKSSSLSQKRSQKKNRMKRRKKKKTLERLLESVPHFEDYLKGEQLIQWKSDLCQTYQEKYFKYYYRLNNQRYQYILVY